MNVIGGIRTCAWAFVVLGALLVSGPSHAQAGAGVEITTAAFKEIEVKAEDGTVRKQQLPVARVVPGDVVVYEISYANKGGQAANDVAINNAVPTGVTFVEAVNPPSVVSVDKGKQFGPLGDLRVEGPDGQVRPAQPADISNLRWQIASLAPGASGKVVYRVKVK